MAQTVSVISLCVFLAVTISGAMSGICDDLSFGMISCLDYLQDRATAPSSDCCSAFAKVVKLAPQCLCEEDGDGASKYLVNQKTAYGASRFQVNQRPTQLEANETRFDLLPTACNVDATPVLDVCQGNPTGGGASGGSSTTLSYFIVLGYVPATLVYAFISAAV